MRRATGAQAVMASRAPDQVEADDARTALFRQIEYFPTPPWAARAAGELLHALDPDALSIWEPACGQGHMAAALAETFDVFASDIHPFGYGKAADFFDRGLDDAIQADWIVTNPPFRRASAFVELGLRRARRGVCLLLRLQFLAGGDRSGRYQLLFGDTPLTQLAVFAERPAMTLGRWEPRASTATDYGLFFWMRGAKPRPPIGIPPGTRARLTRPDDAARFGFRAEAGLLDRMEDDDR